MLHHDAETVPGEVDGPLRSAFPNRGQVFVLFQAHFPQGGLPRQVFVKGGYDPGNEVLGGGNLPSQLELWEGFIEVPVVDRLEDVGRDEGGESAEVDDEPSGSVELAGYGKIKPVVVTVAGAERTLPKGLPILLFGPIVPSIKVAGAEAVPSFQKDWHQPAFMS
jgi:hypothetical protein